MAVSRRDWSRTALSRRHTCSALTCTSRNSGGVRAAGGSEQFDTELILSQQAALRNVAAWPLGRLWYLVSDSGAERDGGRARSTASSRARGGLPIRDIPIRNRDQSALRPVRD